MKRLLQIGLLLGFAGTLAAAYFVPWVDYPRFRSAATVLANGGRVEQFVVRLPADRIGSEIVASAAGGTAVLEHFKLRDADGNVIGFAARHALQQGAAGETAWVLTIPARGTIALAGGGGDSIDSVVAARGLGPGQNLASELSIDLGPPARSVATTGEFAKIQIELVETWLVSGMDEDGHVRGTLRLNTVGQST